MTITAAWVDQGSTFVIINSSGETISTHFSFNDAINALQKLDDSCTLVQTSRFKKATMRWPVG